MAGTMRIWPDGYWQWSDEPLPTHMSDDFKTVDVPDDVSDDEDATERFAQQQLQWPTP